MEVIGKGNQLIVQLAEKGYTADQEGNVFNSKGVKVNGYKYKMGKAYYMRMSVKTNDKKVYGILKHRFIAFKKFGYDLFEEGLEVRHLNGNSLDNSWSNLELGTHSENMRDIPKGVRQIMASSPKHDHKTIIEDSRKTTRSKVMEKHGISSTGTYHFIINNSLEKKRLESA